MQKVDKNIKLEKLREMSKRMFPEIVKAVVDIEKQIMIVDAPMHVDEELFLLENGSEQKNLWGINLNVEEFGKDNWIIFDSMINMRPMDDNMSRGVDNPQIQKRIKLIVNKLVTK